MHARRLRLAVLAPVLVALAAPAASHAAAKPLLSLTPEQVGASRSVLAGARWRVRVVAQPWVEGTVATVRFYRNGKRIKKVDVPLAASATGQSGMAVVPFTSGAPGRVTVQATHLATPGLPTLKARQVRVRVLPLQARPGERGPVVRLLQQKLAAKGYVVGQRGLYDARTARAVLAFRKVTGMARTAIASSDVFRRLLAGGGTFRVRHPDHGKH
ncbi:MAG: peptidoglycan-binding protein, partial [Solirubrobacteraceae bacterium]